MVLCSLHGLPGGERGASAGAIRRGASAAAGVQRGVQLRGTHTRTALRVQLVSPARSAKVVCYSVCAAD